MTGGKWNEFHRSFSTIIDETQFLYSLKKISWDDPVQTYCNGFDRRIWNNLLSSYLTQLEHHSISIFHPQGGHSAVFFSVRFVRVFFIFFIIENPNTAFTKLNKKVLFGQHMPVLNVEDWIGSKGCRLHFSNWFSLLPKNRCSLQSGPAKSPFLKCYHRWTSCFKH